MAPDNRTSAATYTRAIVKSRWFAVTLLTLPLVLHVGMLVGGATTDMEVSRMPDEARELLTSDWTSWGMTLLCTVYGLLVVIALRSRYLLPRFLLATYTTIVTLIAAECFFAYRYPAPPQAVPFLPFYIEAEAADTMPGITGRIVVSANQLGLRGPEALPRDFDYRILCIGGSSTECLAVTDELTWPWRLQTMLAARLQAPVFVGNAGRSGHFTLNHEYMLHNYGAVQEFDWVVIQCGINDAMLALNGSIRRRMAEVPQNTLIGNPRDVPSYRNLAITRLLRPILLRLSGRAIVTDAAGDFLRDLRDERLQLLQQGRFRKLPDNLDDHLTTYRERVRRLIAGCREKNLRLVMTTQPTLYSPCMPDDLERLCWGGTNRSGTFSSATMHKVMDRYNRSTIDVCRQENIDCIDLASMLPKDTTIFYDHTHFNISGCARIAEILTDYFAERLGQREPGKAADRSRRPNGGFQRRRRQLWTKGDSALLQTS